jgi:hypothetical protein
LLQAFPVSFGRELVEEELEERTLLCAQVVELSQIGVEGDEKRYYVVVLQVQGHVSDLAVVYTFSVVYS